MDHYDDDVQQRKDVQLRRQFFARMQQDDDGVSHERRLIDRVRERENATFFRPARTPDMS